MVGKTENPCLFLFDGFLYFNSLSKIKNKVILEVFLDFKIYFIILFIRIVEKILIILIFVVFFCLKIPKLYITNTWL